MVHIDTDTTTETQAVRLLVQGQLDMMAVSAFGEALTRATCLQRPVEIDLGKVDFIDGCGLSILMNAMGSAQGAGHELTIVGASRHVRRLIEITDTADRLPPLVSPLEGRAAPLEGRAATDGEMAGKVPQAVRTPAFRI
jgi:anti-anti-sigma factor